MRRFENILGIIFTLGIFTAILFFVLKYTQVPVGNFVDWAIGFATTAWLLTIITIPWNIYFEAQTVLVDAKTSEKKDIKFDPKELDYVKRVGKTALYIAISLHVISACALYALAYFQVSVVGYYGSAASVLLTFLRPAARFYQYLSERLSSIRREVIYPRDDVYELTHKIESMQATVEDLSNKLNKDNQNSWIRTQERDTNRHSGELKQIQKTLAELREQMVEADERVLKEAQKSVLKNNEEIKFVENLVEIVRFIKKA